MSERWDQAGIPHRGWTCVDVEDLGHAEGVREMCGRETIRYVHYMQHDEYEGRLAVGCVCAEKMSGDYTGPRMRENALRRRASRRGKWLTRKWRQSEKGNFVLRTGGHKIVVFAGQKAYNLGMWSYCIDSAFSQRYYGSVEDAKLAAFDAFWELLESGE